MTASRIILIPKVASAGGGAVTASDVAFTPTGSIAATNVQTAIAEVATDAAAAYATSGAVASAVSAHEADTTNVHAASAVSFSATGNIAATDVQAAIAELDTEKATAAALTAHIDDTSDAHDASAISFSATGNIAATDVQAAVAEVASEAAAALAGYQPLDSDLTAIAALTTTSFGRGLLTLANQAALVTAIGSATDTTSGVVELATTAETTTGTDTARAVTPAGLLNATTASNINGRVGVEKNGSLVGTRRRINFIDGAGVSTTVTDDPANEEVDVTITSTVTGSDTVPVGGAVRIESWDLASSTSGTWALSTSINYAGNAIYFASSSSASGSFAEWSRYLTAGTYTLSFLYATINDAAIVKVSIDGATAVTVDTYTAGNVFNNRSTTTGIVVGSSGAKAIRVFSDGKNASSSGHAIRVHNILFVRTA